MSRIDAPPKIRPAKDLGLFSWEGELESLEQWLETDFSQHVVDETIGQATKETEVVSLKLQNKGILRIETCRKLVLDLFI